MKPGFAVLPLEVWADVSEHPLLTRQMLAQIADNNGDPDFTAKLQKLLHECGKHSLRFLEIHAKPSDNDKSANDSSKILESPASLLASHLFSPCKECEFPETKMPGNIKTFKKLTIGHFDDRVLDFLDKIKPLFYNVYLVMMESTENVRILFSHLLPMLSSIRGICCYNISFAFLEQHFPSALARAKELELYAEQASIPAYLSWLSAQQDFDLHGPRLFWKLANSQTIFAIVDAVRKDFLAATTSSSAFVIFLEFYRGEENLRADELTIQNATTREELSIRNASFKWLKQGIDVHYVEIVRHPTGANVKMREWIEKRGYYENKFKEDYEKIKEIWIDQPTIGRITKQAEGNSVNVRDENADGPSTSAKGK